MSKQLILRWLQCVAVVFLLALMPVAKAASRATVGVRDLQGRVREDVGVLARLHARAMQADALTRAHQSASARSPQFIPGPESILLPNTTGDGAIADRFGMAMDAEGELLVIGAPDKAVVAVNQLAGLTNGVAYVYRRVNGEWQFEARLTPKDPSASAGFGRAIATDGARVVIGAPFETLPGPNNTTIAQAGAVYVYGFSDGAWVEQNKLTAAQPQAQANFGGAVDVRGGQLMVGEPLRDQGNSMDAGIATAYAFDGSQWNTDFTLDNTPSIANCAIGVSVAIASDVAFAGAPGCERVKFKRKQGQQWVDGSDLVPPIGLDADARFGERLALFASDLAVSASKQNNAAVVDDGAVLMFTRQGQAFIHQQTLLPSVNSAAQSFGSALALQADRLLIGAMGADFFEGAGYVFERGIGAWAERARLLHPDGGFADTNGVSAGLVDGDAFLGADLDDINPNRAQGSVKQYRLINTNWSFQQRIQRGDGAHAEQFGFSLDVDGDAAIVGSFLDDWRLDENDVNEPDADDRGSASIFRRGVNGWEREAVLRASDGFPEDRFGIAVAIEGDLAAVGAYWDIINDQLNRGSIYIFERINGVWTQTAKLTNPNGAANDFLGFSLDLENNVLVAGAPGHDVAGADAGSALVFARSAGVWNLRQVLSNPAFAAFGSAGIAVSMDHGRIALGAPDSDVGDQLFQGVVHLFEPIGPSWTFDRTLQAADGSADDGFGFALDWRGDALLVGAPGDGTLVGNTDVFAHGGAYEFRSGIAGWSQTRKFSPAILVRGDQFGTSVQIGNLEHWIGAPRENFASDFDTGSVYGYPLIGLDLNPSQTLRDTTPVWFARFGRALALDDVSLLIGAPDEAGSNPREGRVHVIPNLDAVFADGFE